MAHGKLAEIFVQAASLSIIEELCILRICRLLVLPGVSMLTSRLLATSGS